MNVPYYENKPIEIIGKSKKHSGIFVCVLTDNLLWGLHYNHITIKGYSYVTEKLLEYYISHLNPTTLLKRLNDIHYLPKERCRFLNAIQMCYDLNPTEQRLFLMHLSNEYSQEPTNV